MIPQDLCKTKISKKIQISNAERTAGIRIQIKRKAPVYLPNVELIKHLRNILELSASYVTERVYGYTAK